MLAQYSVEHPVMLYTSDAKKKCLPVLGQFEGMDTRMVKMVTIW